MPLTAGCPILAVLDHESGTVRFANAGHVPGLIVRVTGAVEELGSTGPPLGLIEGSQYRNEEAALEVGDLLVLITDGFTEAESADGEEFGLDRLEALLVDRRRCGIEELAELMTGAVEEFTGGAGPTDDRTMLLARRT